MNLFFISSIALTFSFHSLCDDDSVFLTIIRMFWIKKILASHHHQQKQFYENADGKQHTFANDFQIAPYCPHLQNSGY